jgi:hypothetical protein
MIGVYEMKYNKPKFIIVVILIISCFFAGCDVFTAPSPARGNISGRVLIPQGNKNITNDISGWIPVANATVTIVDANGISHTVTTDKNGYYTFKNIEVNQNTLITANVTVNGDTLILKTVITQAVGANENYDIGPMTPESTALALVTEKLLDEGMNPEDINIDEIKNTDNFNNLVEQISSVLEERGNVTEDSTVNSLVDNTADKIINPPAPSAPPSPSVSPPIVAVTAVRINQEDQTLVIGGTLKLSVTITPGNATNKKVTWSSDNESVATVSTQGTVTAVSEGTAIITVTTVSGNKTDTITITVSKIYNQTKNTSYETIQNAIDDADSGDIIMVGVGIYNEAISIDESLTLLGAQAGVDARNRNGDETIIDPNDPSGGANKSWVVRVRASNVIIEGFTIQNPSLIYGSAGLIDITGAWNNIQIKNNIFQNPGVRTSDSTNWGKFGINIEGVSNVLVENNYFRNILCDTATPWNGTAAIWPSGSSNIEILNNRIENITTYGVGLSGDNSNVLIIGNEISLGGLGGTPSWTRSGIRVGKGNDNINISNNNISNCIGEENASAGIRLQNNATVTTEVSGNIVSNINIGIAIEPDANNFDVTGNTFSNIKVLGGYRWYDNYGSYEDLEAVLENNSFPDGSEVQPNLDPLKKQNRIIVPGI